MTTLYPYEQYRDLAAADRRDLLTRVTADFRDNPGVYAHDYAMLITLDVRTEILRFIGGDAQGLILGMTPTGPMGSSMLTVLTVQAVPGYHGETFEPLTVFTGRFGDPQLAAHVSTVVTAQVNRLEQQLGYTRYNLDDLARESGTGITVVPGAHAWNLAVR